MERDQLCRYLRSKAAYGGYITEDLNWDDDTSSTAIYWCLRTMSPCGPDDNFAHAKLCQAGRVCFSSVYDDEA